MTVDVAASTQDASAMHGLRTFLAAQACSLGICLPAQDRVPLPHECGTLARLPGWTVLAEADLAAASRPSDPTAEPARTMLTGIVELLRERKREGDHVLLHAPGTSPGALRLVNAYSAAYSLSSGDLHKPEAAEVLQKELLASLASPGVTVTFIATEHPQVFAIGSVSLSFELSGADRKWHVVHYVVPAGGHVQYFETSYMDGDVDARGEIESLLRTFDGALEGRSVDFWRATLIGGGAGGLAGILAFRLRRRRQLAAAAASEASAG